METVRSTVSCERTPLPSHILIMRTGVTKRLLAAGLPVKKYNTMAKVFTEMFPDEELDYKAAKQDAAYSDKIRQVEEEFHRSKAVYNTELAAWCEANPHLAKLRDERNERSRGGKTPKVKYEEGTFERVASQSQEPEMQELHSLVVGSNSIGEMILEAVVDAKKVLEDALHKADEFEKGRKRLLGSLDDFCGRKESRAIERTARFTDDEDGDQL